MALNGGMRAESPPRVVILHDFMETYGGAERITSELAKIFPEAPVYGILGRPEVVRRMGVEARFRSLLPPQRAILGRYRLLTPLVPALAAAVRLPPADVLLTSSYVFAHRFRTSNFAPQVCYCHTPPRFLWAMAQGYRESLTG